MNNFTRCLLLLLLPYGAFSQSWEECNSKATTYGFCGEKDSSFYYGKLALIKAKKEFGNKHLNYATTAASLAFWYRYQKDFKTAETLMLEALAIRKQSGAIDYDYLQSLKDLGLLYRDMQNLPRAASYYATALITSKAIYGTDSLQCAPYILDLAWLYYEMGEYKKAEHLYMGMIKTCEERGLTHATNYFPFINELGLMYLETGEYKKAEPLLKEVLRFERDRFGTDTRPGTPSSLCNRGIMYNRLGDYEKATALMSQALTMFEKSPPIDSAQYANLLTSLAGVYVETKAYEKAKPLLEKALYIRRYTSASDGIMWATVASNLANLYFEMGNFSEARLLYEATVAERKKILGSHHPDYVRSLLGLGLSCSRSGDTACQMACDKEAWAICSSYISKEHPVYFTAVNNLAFAYYSQNDFAAAAPFFIAAKTILLQRLNTMFSFLSEQEKERYLNSVHSFLDGYRCFLNSYANTNPAVAAEAFNTELTSKGMILATDVQVRQTALQNPDTATVRLFERWTHLKATLAKLYTTTGSPQARIDSMENLANNDEKKLALLSSDFHKEQLLPNANYRDIQSKLGPGEVALEFSSFRYFDFKRLTDTVLYVALLLRKELKEPVMIPLFREEALDAIIKETGNTYGTFINKLYTPNTITKENPLYKLIWQPVEKYLKPDDHIYYAVSGSLHQISFAAISCNNHELLCDRYQLTQLTSTGILLQQLPPRITGKMSVLAFGGVLYNTPLTPLPDTNRLSVSGPILPDATRRMKSFTFLPGTLDEVKSIDSLAAIHHVSRKIYSGLTATEENYKLNTTGSSPYIIHIATHSFFFPDPAKEDKAKIAAGNPFRLLNNPLNRAGLLFSGGNHTWKGEPVPQGREDGILTAYEISNTMLANTQLVVLSACETGLGEIKRDEGVFGLQRAFKAAGANYLLMSLWAIPDEETALFMKAFYKDVFAGKTIEAAYRNAQALMKQKYRDEPYKWAAFVLLR